MDTSLPVSSQSLRVMLDSFPPRESQADRPRRVSDRPNFASSDFVPLPRFGSSGPAFNLTRWSGLSKPCRNAQLQDITPR